MKLTIKNLAAGDFGNYRCISKNSLGETEGSIRVYEIPLPATPSKQVTVAEPKESELHELKRLHIRQVQFLFKSQLTS